MVATGPRRVAGVARPAVGGEVPSGEADVQQKKVLGEEAVVLH